ncbi:DUF979 domain-containing protein [Lactococcus petauri]|uniref:DUF979 domain-containing protein n=1 Tax=Lactococcus petauri TaxID=1940789 RepID=UPI0022E22D76|nr:DUF979 domain-containing protein [Lactococcus petauri]
MQAFIDVSLNIFYVLMGLLMIYMAYKALTTIQGSKRFGTALFWILIAIPFIFGALIPAWLVGHFIVLSSLLTLTKQVTFGKYKALDDSFGEKQYKVLKNKIFIPSFILAFVAVGIAMALGKFTNASLFAIGVASVVALVFALIMTKAKVTESVEDGARLFDSMGPVAILPQLLVALGALFTTAGVGEVISQGITGIVPADNRLLGVVAYVLGMVIFTMIMGNAFAAFSVITAGIGIPFVLAQGANPVIAGALALTAGYCGTLLTPMAANFNIVPAALLEMKDENKVIKVQAPVSLTLIVLHILVMYFIAF